MLRCSSIFRPFHHREGGKGGIEWSWTPHRLAEFQSSSAALVTCIIIHRHSSLAVMFFFLNFERRAELHVLLVHRRHDCFRRW